jgi:predicted CoA-binding protein
MTQEKLTLLLGASTNRERYSYKALVSLQKKNIPVIAIGKREAEVCGLKIRKSLPEDITSVHTITMYMNASNQKEYYDLILSLKPSRIIFNPGTLNPELADLARSRGIEVVDGCMLVMLGCGNF